MCVSAHPPNLCLLYPKVVYVLHKVIGLLNSSNATAETLEYYFYACSATSLHPASSFALVLTFPKTFSTETPVDLHEITRSTDKQQQKPTGFLFQLSDPFPLEEKKKKKPWISSHPLLHRQPTSVGLHQNCLTVSGESESAPVSFDSCLAACVSRSARVSYNLFAFPPLI